MPVLHREGDLFNTRAPVIGHGVNCRGAMASGIALEFVKRYPDMELAYIDLCRKSKLQPGEVFAYQTHVLTKRWIFNLASQDLPGPNAKLEWLETALKVSLQEMDDLHLPAIALPRIGSGVGGLDWEDVLSVIEEQSKRYPNITIEIWTYSG